MVLSLVVDDSVLLDASLRSHFYAHFNPRDLAALRCGPSSLLLVNGLILRAWPSSKVAPRSVALSSRVASSWLKLESGASVKVEPSTRSPIQFSSLIIRCQSGPHGGVSDEDSSLVRILVPSMPHFQTNFVYSWPSAVMGRDDVRYSLSVVDGTEDCPLLGSVLSDAKLVIEPCHSGEDQRGEETIKDAPTLSTTWVGGLEAEYHRLRDSLELALFKRSVLWHHKVRPPRGVLLFGPPGTGKSLLARHVAAQMGLQLLVLDGGRIRSKYYGESEQKLKDLFAQARSQGKCIVFIDEIDALCPRRDGVGAAGADLRLVASLLTELDGLGEAEDAAVFVIAATNCPSNIDPALRRPGRLDFEVEIGMPKAEQRRQILGGLLAACGASASPSILDKISQAAHGFVGADLQLLVKEAWLAALSREEDKIPSAGGGIITDLDLEMAFGKIRPSAMREVVLEVPRVLWKDIGGMEDTKRQLCECIEWPLLRPEKFKEFGIRPPKGILLYGPPGCSKTMLAKALATSSDLNFIAVKGPEVFSKWVGDSERAIREIFRKARLAAPSIVFFDEFDAIAARRGSSQSSGSSASERVLSQLLTEMDGTSSLTSVTILAATNRPDIIVRPHPWFPRRRSCRLLTPLAEQYESRIRPC